MTPATDFTLLDGPSEQVAPRLLGCILERQIDGERLRLKIVETEAYDQSDAASHSYRGRTPRTDVMFGPAGHLYVYFTYGLHYCCNVVTGPSGQGAAVLIRAVEPLDGWERLRSRRPGQTDVNLTNGPAKLCQALAIDRALNGHDLHRLPLRLLLQPPIDTADIGRSVRVGISQAQDTPWRFLVRGNRYVSEKR